jgi:hypothetical protein
VNLHPTLTAWNRDEEEGGYKADIDDWTLRVHWHPGQTSGPPRADGPRRGFTWSAVGPDDRKLSSTEVREEIEHAMALAEQAVALARASTIEGGAPSETKASSEP